MYLTSPLLTDIWIVSYLFLYNNAVMNDLIHVILYACRTIWGCISRRGFAESGRNASAVEVDMPDSPW